MTTDQPQDWKKNLHAALKPRAFAKWDTELDGIEDKISTIVESQIAKAREEGYAARGTVEGAIKTTMIEANAKELAAERERVMARVESEIRKHGSYMDKEDLIKVIRAKV